MENRIKINERTSVGIETSKGRTCIKVYDMVNGITVLSDIETDEYFTSEFKYNEYYIVAYSKGCMANQIPLSIDGAYSIKERRKLELSPKLRQLLENMFVSKRCFGLEHVLEAINVAYLHLIDLEDTDVLPNYLCAENYNVTNAQCAEYILQCYPKLKPYIKLEVPLSVVKYREIEKKLRRTRFYFLSMPQELLELPDVTG